MNTRIFTIIFLCIALQNNTAFCMNSCTNNDNDNATENKQTILRNLVNKINIIKLADDKTIVTRFGDKIVACCTPATKNQLRRTSKYYNALASKKNEAIFLQHPLVLAPQDQMYCMRYFAASKSIHAKNIVINLLNNGINPQQKLANDILTLSPLECARLNNNDEIATILLNTYEDKDRPKYNTAHDQLNTKLYKKIALFIYTNKVKKLMSESLQLQPSNINEPPQLSPIARYTKNKMPAPCVAACLGHEAMVSYFILHHRPYVTWSSNIGKNALHYAIGNEHINIIELLLPHFSEEIDKPDNCGNSILHHAALGGNTKIISLLLKNKSRPNIEAVNGRNRTPLFIATQEQNLATIKQLINHGANVHHLDQWKQNLLHILAEREPTKDTCNITQYLITNGVNINQQNAEGLTPLQLAEKKGNQCVINALKIRSASATNNQKKKAPAKNNQKKKRTKKQFSKQYKK